MLRFLSCVFLALFLLVVLAPSNPTCSDAVSLVTVSGAAAGSGSAASGATGADAADVVDEDDVDEDDDDAADDEDYSADDDDEDDDDVDVEDDEDDEDDDDDDDDDLPPEDDAPEDEAAPDQPAVLNPPGKENDNSYVAPIAASAVFSDDFQSGLSKWTHTSTEDYSGEFAVGQGANPTLAGDRALIIPEKARKYGLSAPIKGMHDLSGKSFVVQYEVKLDQGMTCGGAYIKLPLADFDVKTLTGDTPYSIMFGPDKCGTTDKVHFIFQSKNPKTGKRTEHHLETPPHVANSYDKKTHLYTLIVHANATFELLVDNEKKSYGGLADKFDPPVQPAEEIDDPQDKKPTDWVDEKEIADPAATKPADWDEDAPAQIEDEDATKPEGWLDDEKTEIPDPDAKKPEEWDDAEDGEWEAPMVPNTKCDAVGCGEWKRPMKPNPEYKGKWKAPMIKNPEYVGEWKPKKIANPEYYKVETVGLLGIGGIAFEIWTMDHGVLFDNVYIGHDVAAAAKYAEETFVVKQKAEIQKEEEDRSKADAEKKKKKKKGGSGSASLEAVMERVEEAIDQLETLLTPLEEWLQKMGMEKYLDQLIDLGIKKPMLVVVSVPLVVIVLMLVVLGGGRKRGPQPASSSATDTERSAATEAAVSKKTDAVTEDVDEGEAGGDEGECENIDEGEDKDDGLRHRSGAGDDS